MNRIGRAGLPVACLAVATLLAWALERWARLDDASPIYLLAVTAVAVACGTVPAIATAVAAFFVYNFVFVEPRLSLAVAGGQELLTLIVLLVVGIVIGRLAGIGRDRAAVALRREREARALFGISRSLATSARAEATLPVVMERVAETLRARWPDWAGPMELVVVESPYRALVVPLLRYMDALQLQDPSRPILVVLSEFVPQHWWQHLLHNQTALRLKLRLFARRNTIVADVPYHVGGVG